MSGISRRSFLKIGAGSCIAPLLPGSIGCSNESSADSGGDGGGNVNESSKVYAFLADELSEIYDLGKKAAGTLGITKNSLTGAKVFIKPNVLCFGLTPFDPENGECTKQEIVFGVAEMCLQAGAAKVTIADGAQGIHFEWEDAIFCRNNVIQGATNIKSAVDYLKSKYGDPRIELLCLNEVDQWDYIPSSSHEEPVKNGLMIAKSFYEADHVISIAVPKSHVYTMMTGAIKNYFGVVPAVHLGMPSGEGRIIAHAVYYYATCGEVPNIGVTGAYMDILKWRLEEGKQDFAILDCTIGIEADGPNPPPTNKGTTIDHKERNRIGKYSLLASNDFVSADSIAVQIMNFPFDTVKQFAVASKLKLGEIYNIKLVGAELEDLIISDWVKPKLVDEALFVTFSGMELRS